MAGTGRESTRGRTLSATGQWPVRSSVALSFPPGPLSFRSKETLPQPSFFPDPSKNRAEGQETLRDGVTNLAFGEPSRRSRQSGIGIPTLEPLEPNFHSRLLITIARLDSITRTHRCV